MDLVDIDKVLDDLELNESTNNSSSIVTLTTTTASAVAAASPPQAPSVPSTSSSVVIQQCSNVSSIKNDKLSSIEINKDNNCPSTPTVIQTNNYRNIGSNNDETDSNKQQQQNKYSKLYEDDNFSGTTRNPTSFEEITSSSSNKIIDNDRIKNKKYVTVSNVFSSLDDYRRDVESLQQQQQNTLTNIEKLSSSSELPSSIPFTEIALPTSIPKSINDVIDDDGKLNDPNNKTIIDNEETNNTEVLREQHNANDDDDNTEDEPEDAGGYTTSSSSITTSSPSSFSSGPSPGSPSIDESGSFVLGGGAGARQDQQQQQQQQSDDSQINNEQNDKDQEDKDGKNSDSQTNNDDDDNNKKKQQSENTKENSELGLSSISSSYLYCENVLSSLPCSSQDMKFDALSSISSTTTSSKIMATTTTTHTQNFDLKENDESNKFGKYSENFNDLKQRKEEQEYEGDSSNQNQDISQKERHKQQQKVVGFGSTMDEISDTELDSILQEIDNDFQMCYAPSSSSQQQQQQPQQPQQSSFSQQISTTEVENNNNSIDEISAETTDTVSKVPLSNDREREEENSLSVNIEKVNAPSLTKSHENDVIDAEGDNGDASSSQQYPQTTTSIDDENNLQNADSFSQASTIEFAELRLQTDFDVDINDEKNMMNVGTTSTTPLANNPSRSSIDCDQNMVIESLPATLSLKDADSEKVQQSKDISNDERKAVQGDHLQNDNENDHCLTSSQQHQLQRPNSLDLPTQMDVKMYINSTAGQTPPASRLDDISLLSTSSSDDQQLSSSEQHRITSPNEQNQQISSIHSVQSQNHQHHQDTNSSSVSSLSNKQQLGKIPPFWIPDNEAPACMQCKQKFSLIKRRHHCRACGQVLCSVCCSQKAKLVFLGNQEARVCIQCSLILNDKKANDASVGTSSSSGNSTSNLALSTSNENILSQPHRSPNPNNPMEYCSVISPYQQVGQQTPSSPISVMVPVGVLKREGAPKSTRKDKNVIFSDGIRPGCDLTELDNSWDTPSSTTTTAVNSNRKSSSATGGGSVDEGSDFASNSGNRNNESGKQQQLLRVGEGSKRIQTPSGKQINQRSMTNKTQKTLSTASTTSTSSVISDENESYIPKELNNLPPICVASNKTELELKDVQNNAQLIERLQSETLKFVIQRNFFIYVKIVKLKCCVNKTIINFTTQGMHHVGQDEIIILLEYDNSQKIPKDIFIHLNEIYIDADHGYPITELGFSMPKQTNFLESREHGGFLYIRPTFQCLQEIHLPESPYLIGILIHRWEVPWAKIFPLRLMLRLGAEYRYYPSPHISIRGRNSVYAEIAQTIINFLADFRNYSYTLATIRGMYIHMEDRRTNILIPKNRYDQIVKALNNSSDHILALGANFSKKADGHLVCIQNMEADCPETHTYSTQAINIQGQARKVTGASFIVFNGALKTTSGLTGKCNIVEDGLMVQVLPAKMQAVRNSLKNMKDIDIVCGPNDVDESQSEIVSIKWTENDTEFNIGVKSPIDGKKMDGIPSIRVHLGLNYSNKNHIIRWTEVFIMQYDEDSVRSKDPIDISKISEHIAKNTSVALLSFLDLLAANGCLKIGLRATLHQENVCYEAGSKNSKLPPLYMNALDNKLIPILHKQATSLDIDTPVVLELIFHILNK